MAASARQPRHNHTVFCAWCRRRSWSSTCFWECLRAVLASSLLLIAVAAVVAQQGGQPVGASPYPWLVVRHYADYRLPMMRQPRSHYHPRTFHRGVGEPGCSCLPILLLPPLPLHLLLQPVELIGVERLMSPAAAPARHARKSAVVLHHRESPGTSCLSWVLVFRSRCLATTVSSFTARRKESNGDRHESTTGLDYTQNE